MHTKVEALGVGVRVRTSEGHGKVPHFLKWTPLGPQRGLKVKRHDLQESDVRHCYLAVGLVRSGLTRFFHFMLSGAYRGYNLEPTVWFSEMRTVERITSGVLVG